MFLEEKYGFVGDEKVTFDKVADPDAIKQLISDLYQHLLTAIPQTLYEHVEHEVEEQNDKQEDKEATKDLNAEKDRLIFGPFVVLICILDQQLVWKHLLVEGAEKIIKSNSLLHRFNQYFSIRGPVHDVERKDDDLHDMHQVPHGFERDCEAYSEANIRKKRHRRDISERVRCAVERNEEV